MLIDAIIAVFRDIGFAIRSLRRTPGFTIIAIITLGLAPELGRGFTPDEAILGNHRVLLLTQRYWKNHFGADPAVIGRTVRVDGEAHVIVGVLPESINDWRHLGAADLYRPLGLTDKEMIDRGGTWVRLVGRRSKSLTAAQAAAVIVNFGRRLAADYPQFNAGANWR